MIPQQSADLRSVFHNTTMGKIPTVSSQEAKRLRVADLLRAQVKYTQIMEIVGVSRHMIADVRRRLEAGDDLKEKPRVGNGKILTPAFLSSLEDNFKEDPFKSVRKMAIERGVCPQTILNGLKKLHMESRVRPHRHFISQTTQFTRVTKAKLLLAQLKKKPKSTHIIFSDKKMFRVDQAYNRRNSRAVVKSGEDVPPISRTKNPQGVMVLGIVSSDGKKCPPYFFPQGLKINAQVYMKVPRTHVLPWLKKTYPGGNYIWQQDSAPAHRANVTQRWMDNNFANYWPWALWPPSAPDANPLDYAVWGVMDRKARATPHRNVDDLKTSILREWDNLSKDFIVNSCKSFRRRIEAIVEAEGGHIEK